MGPFLRPTISKDNLRFARDTQLSTYFLETDVVITADKALLEILEECRPYAPCELPDGILVAAGALGVANLIQLLEA